MEALLDQLAASDEGAEREQLVAKLTASLRIYAQFEAQEIRPFLARDRWRDADTRPLSPRRRSGRTAGGPPPGGGGDLVERLRSDDEVLLSARWAV